MTRPPGSRERLWLISGRAGITSVWDNANATPAIRSTKSTPTGFFTRSGGPGTASSLIRPKLAAAPWRAVGITF